MRRFERMILDFLNVLERMGIDYVIIGGVAVSSWGNPRTTTDLDVIVALKNENMDELCRNLHEAGFSIDKNDLEDSFKEKTHFSIFDKYSEYHADVKGVYDKFDALTVRNRVLVPYEGHNMCIASAEDTIAHKLLFGGYQDVKDAESILLRQSELDMGYLEELCGELGVLDELEIIKKRIKDL
ncbi:MAG: hypothetical protein HXS46_00180 [Theionarchaea archaeon]|nr:hypothetical protein [Theionarchaea archaeon]